MKTIQSLFCICTLLCLISCSSSETDDSDEVLSTQELLTSGKWYQESQSPGSFSPCEKNTSFQFNTDGSVIIEGYNETSGSCQLENTLTASYTLSGLSLTVSLGSETISATVENISTTELTLSESTGAMTVFDKIKG
jgi:hypothetical protein